MAFACAASSCASDQDKAAVSDIYYINIVCTFIIQF